MPTPAAVKAIFLEAAAIDDPVAREALLAERCGDDAILRDRVVALLCANEQAVANEGTMTYGDGAAIADTDSSATAEYPSKDEHVGVIIAGRYKLLQQIGEGGMGTVWMADQIEPVKRRVAVKLIRVERGQSKTILARFEAERQAIALMDHPNIAKLLDAGTTEQGAPYFVMELVKGIPLNDYCDTHKLNIPDRLHLFQLICGAVQHAHQKGIIHRDIKPSNILVESHDGKAVPKVIDFGLAKATSGMQLTENTLFTGFGTVMGTPTYMAPEQATFNAVDVDTRADIYALGVILYELLTGTTPLTREVIKKAQFDEMLKLVREQEAPTPSSRLSGSDSLPSVSANRQTEPAKLGRFVKGELDWIVLKALSKERDRRYETANGFAKDIERFLNHEPVTAGPPSTRYRLQKFVQRNRGQVIAATLVLCALLAGIAGTTVGLVRAIRAAEAERLAKLDAEEQKANALQAADREAAERKRAEAKEAEANAVVTFFQDKVFAAARPKGQASGLGSDVTLRDAIVASVHALEKVFDKQPLIEARLRHTIGLTFSFLGEFQRASEQNERAKALFTTYLGPEHRYTLASMGTLANSYADLNRHAEALKLREEVLAIQQRMLPQDHPDTLKSMNNLALSYSKLNRHAEAYKLHEETLAIQKRVLLEDHPDTLKSMNNLANSCTDLNRHAEALKLREEVLAIQQRALPQDHPDTLVSMNNLAVSYVALSRHAEALKLREETLAIRKRVLPQDHPDTLMSMTGLAASYLWAKKFDQADELLREMIESAKRTSGVESPAHSHALSVLGLNLLGRKKWDKAEPVLRECLTIREKRESDKQSTYNTMSALGGSLLAQMKYAEAEPLLVKGYEGLKAREKTIPQGSTRIPEAIDRLIELYTATNKTDEVKKWQEVKAKLPKPEAPKLPEKK